MSHDTPLVAAHAEALRRIQEAKSSGAWWLDLGDLPIERLPDEIAELKELRVLALGRSKPIVEGTSLRWELILGRPVTISSNCRWRWSAWRSASGIRSGCWRATNRGAACET